ncbi:MAG: hypothetical protein ACFFCS_04770 [Candidatus Hodarchaeota archaeon]
MMTDVIDFGIPILHVILIITVWIFEGFALKFVDQVVDEGKKPPKPILVGVIMIAGLFAGFSMAIDTVTTAMVLALITGVILGGKIDNTLWYIQILLVLAGYNLFFIYFIVTIETHVFIPLRVLILYVVVALFTFLDEVFHDKIDNTKINEKVKFLLTRRWLMKIAVIMLVFIYDWVLWYHAVSWILFDITYDITGYLYTGELHHD